MPASYTMDAQPKPNNPAVKLKEIDGKHFAVIRFSGTAGEERLKRYAEEPGEFISAKTLKFLAVPAYAFLIRPGHCLFLAATK